MLLFVGDDRQAIYGFTGADSDAMDVIAQEFACERLPMTVTRRCSQAVVLLAQTLVPDYKAHEGNCEGSVSTISEKDFFENTVLVPGEDAVICRNTAPLVRAAYKLIARGVPAHVEGKDIGRGLIEFIERFRKANTVAQLRDLMNAYLEKQTVKLTAAKKDAALGQLVDQIDTINAILETMPSGSTVATLTQDINDLFADTKEGEKGRTVTLMTAHRSKGREFERVFGWGNDRFFPSPYAKQEWQQAQEWNLLYVLWTRTLVDYIDVVVEE